ncbi:S-layer homology domain-containing protein [Papillibacter cinnamivorans]|uniref:S-layer homology domain-containing protein n=1 Tax=Papillibacter cinnamivorans DSM 12816 TaxID=1122930 RepID=A0A1W2BV70_9FIRM|nr:S-layer homology domain-containing protein [Papillibacter cinnamivorans]SMC76880.1 S-layer homology domain-containing protein [Papillibacter cinnamivorans DSM 12816]
MRKLTAVVLLLLGIQIFSIQIFAESAYIGGTSQIQESNEPVIRHISGTIRLPGNEIAENPIQCRILLLDREQITEDGVVDSVPTEITAILPQGANQVEYRFDYSCGAYQDPVLIDCRISGDDGYTEDNFYAGDSTTPYWYRAVPQEVSGKDSEGVNFTVSAAVQIRGEFKLPEAPEQSGPTLAVTMRAFSDMGTPEKDDDFTIEKDMVFFYGASNEYTLAVPDEPSGYIVSYRLHSFYDSHPYVYNGIPTSGYYDSTGIKQLKTYSEKISPQSGCADEIDFAPPAYDYEGLTDVKTHWAKSYIYEMTARGILSTKDASDTFRPDDCVTRGECVEAAIGLFGLNETASEPIFNDVTSDTPYYKAVTTAYHCGLIKGCPDGNFYPNDPITRQDMEVILYRGIVGRFQLEPDQINIMAVGDPSLISDKDEIAPYAYDAVALCFQYYIDMFKTDNRSNPRATLTRGELASEFYRCLKFLDRNL